MKLSNAVHRLGNAAKTVRDLLPYSASGAGVGALTGAVAGGAIGGPVGAMIGLKLGASIGALEYPAQTYLVSRATHLSYADSSDFPEMLGIKLAEHSAYEYD